MRSGELTPRRGTKVRYTPAIIDNRRRVNTTWVGDFGKREQIRRIDCRKPDKFFPTEAGRMSSFLIVRI
jgi:hypothetical protein